MAGFCRVIGKKITDLEENWLDGLSSDGTKVLVDIGTGDGRFVLDMAREHSDHLCIGIDAAVENLSKTSRVAAAKPKKGGVPNAIFLRGAAENLPGLLGGIADIVTINYPWGSLMKIVSEPDIGYLRQIREICKSGAELSVLLNYSVFEDDDYLERLGLGDLIKPADNEDLPDAYADAGFRLTQSEIFAGDPPIRTMWGRHLVRGSNRLSFMIKADTIEI